MVIFYEVDAPVELLVDEKVELFPGEPCGDNHAEGQAELLVVAAVSTSAVDEEYHESSLARIELKMRSEWLYPL